LITRLLVHALLLAVIVATGLCLDQMGKPNHPQCFAFHKISAFGLVLYAALWMIALAKGRGPRGLLTALIIVTTVSAIAPFVSGGMMSTEKRQEAKFRGSPPDKLCFHFWFGKFVLFLFGEIYPQNENPGRYYQGLCTYFSGKQLICPTLRRAQLITSSTSSRSSGPCTSLLPGCRSLRG